MVYREFCVVCYSWVHSFDANSIPLPWLHSLLFWSIFIRLNLSCSTIRITLLSRSIVLVSAFSFFQAGIQKPHHYVQWHSLKTSENMKLLYWCIVQCNCFGLLFSVSLLFCFFICLLFAIHNLICYSTILLCGYAFFAVIYY